MKCTLDNYVVREVSNFILWACDSIYEVDY